MSTMILFREDFCVVRARDVVGLTHGGAYARHPRFND
jgi:hypothetical protein